MLIGVVNQSSLISNADIDLACQAAQIQLDLHLLPAWNQKSGTVKFYADATKVPGYAWIMSVLDNSTQAGALGYHEETNDRPDGFVFAQPVLSNGGVALYDPKTPQGVTVSSVLSHEICEMVGDKFAAWWSDGPAVTASDGQTYTEYALELCDAVEGDSYLVQVAGAVPVNVSNFIFPSWFNAEATAVNLPFDYLGKLTKPFSMTPGGYLIVRQSGNTQQIFGEQVSEETKAKVKAEWYRR